MVSGNADYTGDANVTIENASIAVTQSGTWNIAAISGTVDVAQSGDWTIASITGDVNVEVQNSTLAVTQSGTWNIGAISGTVDVAQSGNWDIQNISGTVNVDVQNVSLAVTGTVEISSGAVTISSGDVTVEGDIFITGTAIEQHKISVTAASTQQVWTNACKAFLFYNDGPYCVYVNFGGAATTSHFKIPSGVSFNIDIASQDTRFICDTGKTASVYGIGMY